MTHVRRLLQAPGKTASMIMGGSSLTDPPVHLSALLAGCASSHAKRQATSDENLNKYIAIREQGKLLATTQNQTYQIAQKMPHIKKSEGLASTICI